MKTIYLVMRRDNETKQEGICFAVDGTRSQAAERMIEYVNGNDINTERFLIYLREINCYCN